MLIERPVPEIRVKGGTPPPETQPKARDGWDSERGRPLREARRRTKVVGAFPDGQSALMLVAARLRHVSATHWGTRKYMNMKLLDEMEKEIRYSAA